MKYFGINPARVAKALELATENTIRSPYHERLKWARHGAFLCSLLPLFRKIHLHAVGRIRYYDDHDNDGDDEDTETTMTTTICNLNTRFRRVFPDLDLHILKVWISCHFLMKQTLLRVYPDCYIFGI
jgi:hypothetical protein